MHLLITVVLKYFLLYPAEKDRVLDKFHETLGSAGYSFGISNLFPCGGAAVRLSIMKVKGEKQVTFKYKAKWLNFMKRILISATKDMDICNILLVLNQVSFVILLLYLEKINK